MSFYIDSSAAVALLVTEPHSARVTTWLERQPPGAVFVSEWTHPEVASALSIKLRTGQITLDRRAAAIAAWNLLQSVSIHTLGVAPEHFTIATRIATQFELGVRASDALHLAVTAESGFTLVTLDAMMVKAAPLLGIPVEPLD